ncbi:hypothetical protein PVAP13_9NG227273 [Panicum virgatum]|uniref:Uncharacterized protein n=1 Tax=Panicum virgatum TaxID=38727 RepID=A0A8T0MHM3_PANVG|nr:hypothetical protein PVAP13_9NG227273 [Panicum virgatum]
MRTAGRPSSGIRAWEEAGRNCRRRAPPPSPAGCRASGGGGAELAAQDSGGGTRGRPGTAVAGVGAALWGGRGREPRGARASAMDPGSSSERRRHGPAPRGVPWPRARARSAAVAAGPALIRPQAGTGEGWRHSGREGERWEQEGERGHAGPTWQAT